jgi:hypothetical protein
MKWSPVAVSIVFVFLASGCAVTDVSENPDLNDDLATCKEYKNLIDSSYNEWISSSSMGLRKEVEDSVAEAVLRLTDRENISTSMSTALKMDVFEIQDAEDGQLFYTEFFNHVRSYCVVNLSGWYER